jgi:DNA-binding winged helix-turn-helix (wHTH) protein
MNPTTGCLVRFGVFELDLRTGELRKRGARVHLQEQPFQLLAMLLERAGDLVTRDELRRRLWPDDVFVDFDIGLNKAVAKLRTALGDSAESPHFVETLERRGYRFIAHVTAVDAGDRERPEALPGRTPPPARPPRLVRLVGDHRTVVLPEGLHQVGRESASAVWIDSTTVSRRHASITVTVGEVWIEDHGSRNGTFVNGTRVEGRRALAHGDEVRIGPACFVVSSPSDLAATETEPGRA